MSDNDPGKRRLLAILPNSTVFIIVDVVLLLVFSVLVVVRRDIGTIWAVMMIPVLIAALFYPRRTYGVVLGLYIFVSFTVIALESTNKFASYQETAAFLLAVVLAGEILYRLTEARRKVEEALLKSERRFRSLSATAPVGIFETDENGDLSYSNARFRSIAGTGT